MRKEILLPILAVAASFLVILLISGCSEDIKGTVIPNIAPGIDWSDTRIDSSHSSNPELFWINKDIDGQVQDVQYMVLLSDYVTNNGGPDDVLFPDTASWTSVGAVTHAIIPLYASEDTSVYVEQYVFLRNIDDVGALSDVIYMRLSRNNHAPTCLIIVPQDPQWCLPDTTDSWGGISITWEGGDSLDFPPLSQPDFLWEVKVFGPYVDRPTPEDLTNFNPDFEPLYGQVFDPVTGDELVAAEGINLLGLVTGYYIIYVRNFDDAFVAAEPAMDVIEVYEPQWIRHNDFTPILLIDHGRYFNFYGELKAENEEEVQQFYMDMIEGAGITPEQYVFLDAASSSVDISDLFMYRLVIALDSDWFAQIPVGQQEEYANYLKVGGQIWVIGRRSFVGQSLGGRVDFAALDSELPFTYLNESAEYLNVPGERDVVDFTGASPLAEGFPLLTLDTIKVAYTSWYVGEPTLYSEALFGVSYIIRQTDSETIYKFDSLDPFNSDYEGFPVATRYETGAFKTSYFAFPLFFCDLDDAIAVTVTMLDWFELE